MNAMEAPEGTMRRLVLVVLLAGRPERRELVAAAGDSCTHRVHVAEHHGDVVCVGARRSGRRRLDLLPLSAGRGDVAEGGDLSEA